MRIGTLDISAPAYIDEPWNETESFGAAVWLWMHSPAHREAPLHTLHALLLPAIKRRQFVLAVESGRPVFYVAWANLDEEAEARYLRDPPVCMRSADWRSGNRMWFLDWIAPFGHSHAMHRFLAQDFFADCCARALYHRSDEKLRVQTFRGARVRPQDARAWFASHPVVLPTNFQEKK